MGQGAPRGPEGRTLGTERGSTEGQPRGRPRGPAAPRGSALARWPGPAMRSGVSPVPARGRGLVPETCQTCTRQRLTRSRSTNRRRSPSCGAVLRPGAAWTTETGPSHVRLRNLHLPSARESPPECSQERRAACTPRRDAGQCRDPRSASLETAPPLGRAGALAGAGGGRAGSNPRSRRAAMPGWAGCGVRTPARWSLSGSGEEGRCRAALAGAALCVCHPLRLLFNFC